MRALEAGAAAAGIPTEELMERAGLAVAREVRRAMGGAAGARVTVLVGPGNNGSDGLVAARHLADWGAWVDIILLTERRADDSYLEEIRTRGARILKAYEDLEGVRDSLLRAETVLDAVLGTGRSRALGVLFQQVFDLIRAERSRRRLRTIALDIPTGLDADTGALDPAAFDADSTVTLGCPKVGLYRWPGPRATGQIAILDIGIPKGMDEKCRLELMTVESVRSVLPARGLAANKGTFGRVLVIAGSGNFIGAAALACRGAHRAGAGLVTLAAPAPLVPVLAGSLTETTYVPLAATGRNAVAAAAVTDISLDGYAAVAIGCGLGQDTETREFLISLLLDSEKAAPPLVLDADALNLLAETERWWGRMKTEAVLTPHPGEMARLLKRSVEDVQDDRVETARAAAAAWSQTVVLKGAHTVVARPDGLARISPFAVPALASGGTGDVLTGIIAGLMAQGVEPFEAATAGVFLHGRAGALWTESHGDSGLMASDLTNLLPDVMREVKV